MQDYDTSAQNRAVTTERIDDVVVASDDGVIIEDNGEADERPEDCQCREFHGEMGLSCFPCYRDGFETPPGE